MTTLTIIGTILIILALGFVFDLLNAHGQGMVNIIKAIKGQVENPLITNDKFIHQIKEELDDLYDDLTYDANEKEIHFINSKIAIRENMLKERLK